MNVSYYSNACAGYQNKSPTSLGLLKDAPPEYYPMLVISAVFMLLNTTLLVLETRRHSKYFGGIYFKLSSRVMMMLSAFWLFGFTSFLGMIFIRGAVFLHFIANTFESVCILAFFDCLVVHLRSLGEVFDGKSLLSAQVPPCCCCLLCLPTITNTKKNLGLLRLTIFQLIFCQSGVEFLRVLTVFDCSFDPERTRAFVMDTLVSCSFLLGMWGLFVLFKSGQEKLRKFRYILKFAGFKVLIIISKFLYKILNWVAKRGWIPPYNGLGAKQRATIWTNFITVVVATLAFTACRRLYKIEDYTPLVNEILPRYNSKTDSAKDVEENTSNDAFDEVLLDGASEELPQDGRYAKLKSSNSSLAVGLEHSIN